MAYDVTPVDIEARWRPLSDAESDVAFTLLESAGVMLDTKRKTLAAEVIAGRVPFRLVVDLLCEAVIRVLRNPDVVRAQNVGGDGGVGINFGGGGGDGPPAPRLVITDADLVYVDKALRDAAAAGSRVRTRRLVAYPEPVTSTLPMA